ncbi:portal protein [Phenylobacterium sp.]|uniref:portal protein n=1 Tax=Phenylobacterium sp. TaxID=1871053 RepID=UPI002FC7165B
MTMAEDIAHYSRTLADLKAQRLSREGEWQQIADYFAPRKDFNIAANPAELRRRRLTSSVPAVAARRCAGMLAAYLVDPSQPFIKPNADRGLIAAGRDPGLDAGARDYLDTVEWAVFDRMMLPKSGWLSAVSRLCLELVTFGTGILWTGRERGFGPTYQARPLRSSWIAENDRGQVDTVYYEFTLPLWRVFKRWENARLVDGWADADENAQQALVTLLHVVEPRKGGEKGAAQLRKPFREAYVCLDKKVVLEESGYDSFPFSVPRLDVEPGSVYGTGLCWHVLPDAIALSALQQATENAVDLRVNPPLLYPARMFGKALDRRAGAVNAYDAAGLGFQSAREALQKLEVAGDANIGEGYMRLLIQNIEQGLFTDWMRLRESGQMTAEEVIERRELRLRSMSSFIPGVDRDLMGNAADRTLDVMYAEGQLPTPPESLAGTEVDWDYAGPLARSQMQRQAEGLGRLFNLALVAQKLDPSAPYVLAVDEGLRAVAEAYGGPIGTLRSRKDVEAYRAAQAEREEAAESLALAQQAATTARDGGQAIASLAGAQQTQQMAA